MKSEQRQTQDNAAAERLRALGHPVRLAIVRALAEQNRCCCSDVCSLLPLAQSTVSQHLKVLKDAGLIICAREGVRSNYILNGAAFAAWRADLDVMFASLGRHPASRSLSDG